MGREVLARKLNYLRQLLLDLTSFADATLADVTAEHYKLERIFELLVMTASDILFHTLAEQNLNPDSYREAFQFAAQQGLLPNDLAERLQNAAAVRNIIVHLYEEIDYAILRAGIHPALNDFAQFVALFAARLDDE